MESKDDATAEHLIWDYRKADLSDVDRKLCDYAVKLTISPGKTSADDVQILRDAGVTDEQVTIAAQVIGYFNYINRIAEGLGVENEDWMKISKTEWLEKKGKF